MALRSQSGSAEPRTGGALELRCFDVSRGCSVATFKDGQELLTAVASKLVEAVWVNERQ